MTWWALTFLKDKTAIGVSLFWKRATDPGLRSRDPRVCSGKKTPQDTGEFFVLLGAKDLIEKGKEVEQFSIKVEHNMKAHLSLSLLTFSLSKRETERNKAAGWTKNPFLSLKRFSFLCKLNQQERKHSTEKDTVKLSGCKGKQNNKYKSASSWLKQLLNVLRLYVRG